MCKRAGEICSPLSEVLSPMISAALPWLYLSCEVTTTEENERFWGNYMSHIPAQDLIYFFFVKKQPQCKSASPSCLSYTTRKHQPAHYTVYTYMHSYILPTRFWFWLFLFFSHVKPVWSWSHPKAKTKKPKWKTKSGMPWKGGRANTPIVQQSRPDFCSEHVSHRPIKPLPLCRWDRLKCMNAHPKFGRHISHWPPL